MPTPQGCLDFTDLFFLCSVSPGGISYSVYAGHQVATGGRGSRSEAAAGTARTRAPRAGPRL
ncbi:unnamed protein product [Nyctereutes procyonoides]|uniref:(raccoon dog) hypothetical protein n=1 Tax=Nyctereutes procyonoides TaxID=34880 RepID=A0A811ZI26_NYCPR|nr:unnamed protein product [Nyctereutes procyonoides]